MICPLFFLTAASHYFPGHSPSHTWLTAGSPVSLLSSVSMISMDETSTPPNLSVPWCLHLQRARAPLHCSHLCSTILPGTSSIKPCFQTSHSLPTTSYLSSSPLLIPLINCSTTPGPLQPHLPGCRRPGKLTHSWWGYTHSDTFVIFGKQCACFIRS